MLEKELALKLFERAQELEIYNCQAHVPVDLSSEIDKCNFELLQKECDKLNFHICYAFNAPFDTEFYKKEYKKSKDKYLVYTDKSIYNVNV